MTVRAARRSTSWSLRPAGRIPAYNPLGTANSDVNPWRYAYPGTNNPGSYDLWIQLDIAGNTNLICNWTKSVQINNNSLP